MNDVKTMSIKEMADKVKSNVSVPDVLNYFGIDYKNQGSRVIFSLRPEKKPSCSAVIQSGVWAWKDFGDSDLRGSVIDLYNYLKNNDCSFNAQVVKEMYAIFIANKYKSKSQSVKNTEKQSEKKQSVKNVKQNEISVEIMSNFLDAHIKYLKSRYVYPVPDEVKPVKYLFRNKAFYGIGIQTISGSSWVIRQTLDKSSIRYLFSGKSDISFWKGNNQRLIIVEGMFDALSVRKLEKERNNILILNSTSNVNKALRFLEGKEFKEIILALDNDEAGSQATIKIYKALKDKFKLKKFKYSGKDLNEYLMMLKNFRQREEKEFYLFL